MFRHLSSSLLCVSSLFILVYTHHNVVNCCLSDKISHSGCSSAPVAAKSVWPPLEALWESGHNHAEVCFFISKHTLFASCCFFLFSRHYRVAGLLTLTMTWCKL
ncbi:hypothetical protein ATANTOWER_011329 [Ataeniobius toweri]|uniref:Secreted protein n=1 Tax=Ataeniobius toweri TaxID=208326 RepID=A0ABU7AXY9_9TELE|nr:hypothetical protein [Ataeniobius toweri]